METFKTGAVRDVGGKGRMDLLPWCAIIRISKHMEDAITPDPQTGTPHYPERNWENGIPIHSMIDSAFRHLAKYMAGWDDEDHLCAAATNLLMAMWTEENRPEMQDIPQRLVMTEVTPSINELGYSIASTNAPLQTCEYFDNGRCSGTRHKERCNCYGFMDKCSFPNNAPKPKEGTFGKS